MNNKDTKKEALERALNTIWNKPDGSVMDCDESIKVIRQNLEEIQEVCQEAFEDAILMEVSAEQFIEVLEKLVEGLHNPYKR
ncbi:MAG: hypothetical protein CL568_00505 [Alphaproteobacteria bacterium]|jgi:hypothetical protein|nr:hypothetical protein [Alphaproteobacteria bacterium]PPR13176.1 MAG: hypothetical protein CFH42_01598 [Alphaproteobacteria bacterium MarineAlpha12_Bin1]|tara:strand:+ start:234 stop:479 length:246 start_codon:yes stop_codon:yes gene_type:complete